MRIDVAATHHVLGGLCHQLMRITECVKIPPKSRTSVRSPSLPLPGGWLAWFWDAPPVSNQQQFSASRMEPFLGLR